MAKENDSKVCQIKSSEGGKVQIANEVVAIIAGLAATEVEGVASMAGGVTNELIAKMGINNLSKGVAVNVSESGVTASLALNLKAGYTVPAVSTKVQERVKNAIENMTGLTVHEVNIRIEGIEVQ